MCFDRWKMNGQKKAAKLAAFYYGNPSVVKTSVTGVGQIIKR